MRKVGWVATACAVTVIALILFVYVQQDRKVEPVEVAASQSIEPIRLGLPLQPTSALAIIAHDQGFFKAHGLDLEVSYYPSGKRALTDGLYKGKVDAAVSAEVPITFGAINQKSFKIIAALFNADNVNRIVARSDRGIINPADLIGKRIATQHSSAVHYFLHLFMLENGLDDENVDLSFMKAEQLVAAIVAGEIDAFSMREPYVSQAEKALGDNVVIFESPGLYQQFDMLVVASPLSDRRLIVIERLLAGLLDAERLATVKPNKAIDIVARRLKVGRDEIAIIWPTLNIAVSLDQSHLLILENEARWAIKNGLTKAGNMPDYLDYIHLDSLSNVKPDAVNIIH